MADEDKKFSKKILGLTIISKAGRKFGEVGDLIFETKSGELIHLQVHNPTPHAQKLDLEKDKEGHILIPFNAVIAVGDMVVVSEEDII